MAIHVDDIDRLAVSRDAEPAHHAAAVVVIDQVDSAVAVGGNRIGFLGPGVLPDAVCGEGDFSAAFDGKLPEPLCVSATVADVAAIVAAIVGAGVTIDVSVNSVATGFADAGFGIFDLSAGGAPAEERAAPLIGDAGALGVLFGRLRTQSGQLHVPVFLQLVKPLQRLVAIGAGEVWRIPALMSLRVHHERHADLPKVRKAGDGLGLPPGLVQRRQEHGNEHCDDANDDQKFDQGESARLSILGLLHAFVNKLTNVC